MLSSAISYWMSCIFLQSFVNFDGCNLFEAAESLFDAANTSPESSPLPFYCQRKARAT